MIERNNRKGKPMSALETMRVLDMTQWEAGPSCSQMLAWLGADVVKIEPTRGEVSRRAFIMDGRPQYFLNHNGNKRSLAVDLKSERGRELMLQLVPRFDVIVENQGPGVVERLRLGPDELRAINPALIYARIKGFGLTGPYASFKSFDPLAQASAGLFSVTGDIDGPPMKPGGTFADTGTGMQAALAITAAYVQQQRTGEGQVIELSMQEVMTMFMRTPAAMYWGEDSKAAPRRSRGEGGAPSGQYACKGGGPNDYAFIQLASREMWEALCNAIDRADLITDERFSRGAARAENAQALRAEVGAWMLQQDKFDVMRILGEAGVPCSAIYDSTDMFHDPHLKSRDFFLTLQHPTQGEYTAMRSPIRMSASKVDPTVAPDIGEHSQSILREELNLADAEISELVDQGIIAIEGEA